MLPQCQQIHWLPCQELPLLQDYPLQKNCSQLNCRVEAKNKESFTTLWSATILVVLVLLLDYCWIDNREHKNTNGVGLQRLNAHQWSSSSNCYVHCHRVVDYRDDFSIPLGSGSGGGNYWHRDPEIVTWPHTWSELANGCSSWTKNNTTA